MEIGVSHYGEFSGYTLGFGLTGLIHMENDMTTKLGRAARQLLEALENRINGMCPSAFEQKAITAMREALDHSGEANEMVVPNGYALVSIAALKAWGKYDEVRNACQFPAEPMKQEPVAWQEAVSNVANNLGEMASQAHSQRFCDEINEQVDILFSLIVGGKYEQKN